jgi:hypothetical protein
VDSWRRIENCEHFRCRLPSDDPRSGPVAHNGCVGARILSGLPEFARQLLQNFRGLSGGLESRRESLAPAGLVQRGDTTCKLLPPFLENYRCHLLVDKCTKITITNRIQHDNRV